jgi:ABC-type antimicrobial peptide transport system permease subunit
MTLVARGPVGGEESVVGAMRQAVREIDSTVPLHTVASMHDQIRRSTAPARFNTALLGTLGAIGLILAAVGIASVIAYFVSLRTQEIGVRMALGASRANVLVLVARQALGAVAVGILAGVALSLGVARLLEATLQGMLVGIAPTDTVTFVIVVAVFVVVAALAAYVPARRATRVQPVQALHAG